ncbi:unnamed protein product, partial [Linum tenue]
SPASPETVKTKPPHKLCLFDQLFPLTYTPLILFYANPETPNLQSTDRFIAHTLTVYYPFSGRTNSGNLLIDRFGESISFIHVKVESCHLSDFLKRREPENLNCFLPRAPFCRESFEFDSPVLEMQVSVFACGGVALGWAASHKLIEGFTMISFLKAFSAVSRGGRERAEILSAAPALFRPQSDGNPLVYKRKRAMGVINLNQPARRPSEEDTTPLHFGPAFNLFPSPVF